jgi:hypothetical protein
VIVENGAGEGLQQGCHFSTGSESLCKDSVQALSPQAWHGVLSGLRHGMVCCQGSGRAWLVSGLGRLCKGQVDHGRPENFGQAGYLGLVVRNAGVEPNPVGGQAGAAVDSDSSSDPPSDMGLGSEDEALMD